MVVEHLTDVVVEPHARKLGGAHVAGAVNGAAAGWCAAEALEWLSHVPFGRWVEELDLMAIRSVPKAIRGTGRDAPANLGYKRGTHSELIAGLEAFGTSHDIHVASVENLKAQQQRAPHTLTKYDLIITKDEVV